MRNIMSISSTHTQTIGLYILAHILHEWCGAVLFGMERQWLPNKQEIFHVNRGIAKYLQEGFCALRWLCVCVCVKRARQCPVASNDKWAFTAHFPQCIENGFSGEYEQGVERCCYFGKIPHTSFQWTFWAVCSYCGHDVFRIWNRSCFGRCLVGMGAYYGRILWKIQQRCAMCARICRFMNGHAKLW